MKGLSIWGNPNQILPVFLVAFSAFRCMYVACHFQNPQEAWTLKLFMFMVQQSLRSCLGQRDSCLGSAGKERNRQCRRHKRYRFSPWMGTIPWSRRWQLTPIFLPGKLHGQGNLAGYSPRGHKESDTTEHTHTHIHTGLEESSGNLRHLGGVSTPIRIPASLSRSPSARNLL